MNVRYLKRNQEMNTRNGNKKSIMGINSLSKRYVRAMLDMQDSPEMKEYRHRPSACPLNIHRNRMK